MLKLYKSRIMHLFLSNVAIYQIIEYTYIHQTKSARFCRVFALCHNKVFHKKIYVCDKHKKICTIFYLKQIHFMATFLLKMCTVYGKCVQRGWSASQEACCVSVFGVVLQTN